ncbi:MAG: tRNA preQ1(34) S-adenosylmethionine ribosyltransferase-isomerase QueA [Pseudomonadota bacterium]
MTTHQKVSDYDYQLPERLIAQFPPSERTDSRLLILSAGGEIQDAIFSDIVDRLEPGDLMVLNDTKVIPARVFGRKASGGKFELLLERIVSDVEILAQIRASRAPKIGQTLIVEGGEDAEITVIDREDSFFRLEIRTDEDLVDWFAQVGHMPLPPYIDREDQIEDQDRYQTVFAEAHGAVAAPTAGLHYDDELLRRIRAKGVQLETITLHVGAGTYQPVRAETLTEHNMHSEVIHVTEQVCRAIEDCKKRNGRVLAVGTTVVRSLETAAAQAKQRLIEPFSGETDIFIYPGYEFKVVDLLQTNFHLPQSTLMMLVSAFSGREQIMSAYQHAIEQQYRFFSYGDAMLLELNRVS